MLAPMQSRFLTASAAFCPKVSLPPPRRAGMKQIIASLKGKTPVIVFSKGTHGNWEELVATGAQVLGVDWNLRLADVAARLPARVGVQGNLDPFLLTTRPGVVAAETSRILQELRGRPGHIFNLGHGCRPKPSWKTSRAS